jgi:hypothetical protein
MLIFVIQTLQKKWNKICMKQLADGKHIENDGFPRTLKFKMKSLQHLKPCDSKCLQMLVRFRVHVAKPAKVNIEASN